MYRILLNISALAFLAAMVLCSFPASAVEFEPGVGVGMEYTNNATLAADNEINDLIATAFVGASLNASSGPSKLNASTSLKYRGYTRDTYSDQHYFNLNATASWEMIKNMLDWKVRDSFSQQSIDALNPGTPDNTQNTNVFTFGPDINIKLSATQSVTLKPEYRKFTYEAQNVDNQQNSVDASWSYQMFRTISIGVRGGVNKVDYDEQAIGDNTFNNIHLTLNGNRPRANYSINIGATRVDQEGGLSQRATTGNVSWLLNLTGHSHVRAYFASELTDSNNGLLAATTNPENGDISNQQITSEVLRNKTVRLTYLRSDFTLQSSVWAEFRRQKYELEPSLNREVQGLGLSFSYPLTATLSTGVNAGYSRTKLTVSDRLDEQYTVGGNLTYRLSRMIRTSLKISYQEKDSDLDTEDLSDTRIIANLVYGYGSL